MTSIVVETADLRKALNALKGHVPPAKDWPELGKIHAVVRDQSLELTATNMYSAALAIVSIFEHEDGEVGGTFDLDEPEIPQVLSLFKAKNRKGDDEMGDALRIEVKGAEGDLIITDVSGLFPGRSVTLPRLGMTTNDKFPKVDQVIAAAIAATGKATERIVANAALLAGFEKAARAYGEHLVMEPTGAKGRQLLISCGESFIGILSTIEPDESKAADFASWRTSWEARLPSSPATSITKARRGRKDS